MKKKLFFLFLTLTFGFSEISAWYPEYKPYSDQKIKGDGSYLRSCFQNKINPSNIKTIFEIGSNDAIDAMELSNFYHCHVFSFECNPEGIEICKKNIGSNPNVTLVPLGVWDTTGEMFFYRIIDKHFGASSFFKFNPKARNYPDIIKEGLFQEKIIVHTIRLDEFLKNQNIDNIDLLCMDTQGSAFQVLKSLGDELLKVKYIIVELETHPIYSGEILYQDVDNFLLQEGFIRKSSPLDPNGLFGDVLYVNSSLE